MEYSKENTMTRKEYLKSKKKNIIDFSKLKYPLIIIVIILLSVYVFKQLNVYNNVTKIANKVMEESALIKTMTMYFVQEAYTKDEETSVILYKASDESRIKIPNSENLKNITVFNNKLYGMKEDNLYSIDLVTKEITKLAEGNIKKYIVADEYIYYYTETKADTGVYKLDIASKKTKNIISETVFDIKIDNAYLYIIAKDKTSKSILRYNLNGKDKKLLSGTYIVSDMQISKDRVYFVNSKDGKLYSTTKEGKDTKKVVDKKLYLSNKENILFFDKYIIYINGDDENTLYLYDTNTGDNKQIVKKNITSISQDANVIYFTIKNSIGIYKYDLLTGKYNQITSARTNEYICKN